MELPGDRRRVRNGAAAGCPRVSEQRDPRGWFEMRRSMSALQAGKEALGHRVASAKRVSCFLVPWRRHIAWNVSAASNQVGGICSRRSPSPPRRRLHTSSTMAKKDEGPDQEWARRRPTVDWDRRPQIGGLQVRCRPLLPVALCGPAAAPAQPRRPALAQSGRCACGPPACLRRATDERCSELP